MMEQRTYSDLAEIEDLDSSLNYSAISYSDAIGTGDILHIEELSDSKEMTIQDVSRKYSQWAERFKQNWSLLSM